MPPPAAPTAPLGPPPTAARPGGRRRRLAAVPAPPAGVRLSVVIPATDAPPTLGRCRAAVERGVVAGDEVIVVEGPAGLGAAGARNAGALRARGDVLVFVDADVEVHFDALARLRRAFEHDLGLVATFGGYDDAPAAAGVVSGFRNLLHHHVHVAGAGPAQTFWSGLGAIRREAFAASGGFDAVRFRRPSVEDIDLGLRLSAAGARIELDPAIRGKHLKRWTLPSMVRVDFAARGLPWIGLLLRHRRGTRALNLGWRHRVSAGACAAGAGALARRRPASAAGCLGLVVALNLPFYALLARRRGAREAAAGVALHVAHHLTAVAAVPAGLAIGGLELVAAGRRADQV